MKEVLLRGEGLCKTFTQGIQASAVLDHVDVKLYKGDFTVIMGPSGAGKSTLLYALSGMDTLSSGAVWYGETKMTGLPEKQMAALRAKAFGFVFQQTQLVSNLTLAENVIVAGCAAGRRDKEKLHGDVQRLLEQMQVGDAAERLPSQVSGGEGQRAAIARALINTPGLLYADEPTGALNRANTEKVLDLLTEVHGRGQSILMVTHDVHAASRGDRILYLQDGAIIGEKTMGAYTEDDPRTREQQLQEWLTSLRW